MCVLGIANWSLPRHWRFRWACFSRCGFVRYPNQAADVVVAAPATWRNDAYPADLIDAKNSLASPAPAALPDGSMPRAGRRPGHGARGRGALGPLDGDA